jgi:cytosine/adenosine deaminase-related metal-dependent hydrolase
LILHRAAWVLPIASPPVRNGWVAVEQGRIAALGGPHDSPPVDSKESPDVTGDSRAILPGLVNAHTHLELSWLRGKVPPAESMTAWVRALLAHRLTGFDPPEPIAEAIRELRMTGTALVGDITNSLASYDVLADSELSAAIFHELIGFRVPDPATLVADAAHRLTQLTPYEWLRPVLVPHAPYSVSPDLIRAIGQSDDSHPLSMHLGESREELQFLEDGSGPWRTLIERLGVWTDTWQPPGCGPVEYVARLGLVNERLIAVHGVQFTDDDLERLAAAGATVVTCPRSNRWTGAGTPPIERFYASGVRIAIGTDSLASVEDLNLFNEIAAVRQLAPSVAPSRLLRSATIDGAEALGFGRDFGSIESGKLAALIGVRVPADVMDVEEYLVGGIASEQVQWLEAD